MGEGGMERKTMGYPVERKEAVLKKMLSPDNKTIAELAHEENISIAVAAKTFDMARQRGWHSCRD